MITRDLFTENFNGEYDDEAGMARTNLVTIARAAQGLLDTIDNYENLPEWVQEKIAKVEGMMVTAWDYLESQEAQGIDPRQDVAEGKSDYNFDIEDLKRLERIRDLPTLKAQALTLISKPSAKPMKPEKVEWFKSALENMNSPIKVIKLMYDLMLSGEGHAVVGSRSSMNPNSYRQKFGEQAVSEGSDRVDSLVTNGLKIMRGPTRDDAIAALKTQVGERDFNERRGFYNFYVRQLMDMYGKQSVAEDEKIGNMDADAYDSAMARLKQLAGSGPMKTVYDPNTRRYKNVPTAVQPAQQPRKK